MGFVCILLPSEERSILAQIERAEKHRLEPARARVRGEGEGEGEGEG